MFEVSDFERPKPTSFRTCSKQAPCFVYKFPMIRSDGSLKTSRLGRRKSETYDIRGSWRSRKSETYDIGGKITSSTPDSCKAPALPEP